jgi:hypothetical protein
VVLDDKQGEKWGKRSELAERQHVSYKAMRLIANQRRFSRDRMEIVVLSFSVGESRRHDGIPSGEKLQDGIRVTWDTSHLTE